MQIAFTAILTVKTSRQISVVTIKTKTIFTDNIHRVITLRSEKTINGRFSKMKFKHGDIVYWVERDGFDLYIDFGVVDEEFSNAVAIDRLHLRDTRKIEGIPYKDFPMISNWRKLPKNLSYNKRLFMVDLQDEELENLSEEESDITKPENIKNLLDRGIYIYLRVYEQSYPTTEVDTKLGWRIKKSTLGYRYVSPSVSLNKNEVFTKYSDVQDKVNAIEKEWNRQANLSDEEWNIEQIDREIDRWGWLFDKTIDDKKRAKDFLLSQDRIEDIEIRVCSFGLQWKYSDKKKWLSVEV